LAAAEAARQGGTVTVASAGVPAADHWSAMLRIVYGASVRYVITASSTPLAWEGLIRLRCAEAPPAALPVLAMAHAVVEKATAALLLPPLSGPDLLVDHADWLCRLFGIPVFNIATIGGLVSLHQAIEAIGP
jgi:hypothetical protein